MKIQKRNDHAKSFTQIACLGGLTLALGGGVGCASKETTQQTSTRPHAAPIVATYQAPISNRTYSQDNDRFVGLTGPRGTTGPAGAEGQVGATGATGYGIAGATGARGAEGPQGTVGPRGQTGPAGDVVRGATGAAGQEGAAGPRGATGARGETGTSVTGITGATGPTGYQGPQGVAGAVGEKGPTTTGPTGSAGERGYAGVTGQTGTTGATGATGAGVTGATGAIGATGERGRIGAEGEMGISGVIREWTNFRTVWFDANATTLHAGDAEVIEQISEYLQRNPSLQVGIDNTNTNGSTTRNRELRDQRNNSVRKALIANGTPSRRIKTGSYGDPLLARDNQIKLVLRTAP